MDSLKFADLLLGTLPVASKQLSASVVKQWQFYCTAMASLELEGYGDLSTKEKEALMLKSFTGHVAALLEEVHVKELLPVGLTEKMLLYNAFDNPTVAPSKQIKRKASSSHHPIATVSSHICSTVPP